MSAHPGVRCQARTQPTRSRPHHTRQCSRKPVRRVGGLALCEQHSQLAAYTPGLREAWQRHAEGTPVLTGRELDQLSRDLAQL
jgi:hypothetical protein